MVGQTQQYWCLCNVWWAYLWILNSCSTSENMGISPPLFPVDDFLAIFMLFSFGWYSAYICSSWRNLYHHLICRFLHCSKPFQQVILDYDYTFTTPYCGSETIDPNEAKVRGIPIDISILSCAWNWNPCRLLLSWLKLIIRSSYLDM